jgi:hypothetical protein
MATIYGHTIEEFLKHGTISVAPLLNKESQEDIAAILSVRNVTQGGEFVGADYNIRDSIIRDFYVMSCRKVFGNQDLTERDRAVGELLVRMMPEFLMSFIDAYSKSTKEMYLLEILIMQYQGFATQYTKVLSDFPISVPRVPKPASPPPNLRVVSRTPTVPTPNASLAENVICPSLEPP